MLVIKTPTTTIRTTSSVKTGDTTQYMWYMIGLAAAMILIGGVLISRKRRLRK